MHGARLKMADGKMAQLRLAASEEFGFLRIKAEIPVSDTPKPLTTSVPIFETALMSADHCDPQILTIFHEPLPAYIDVYILFPLLFRPDWLYTFSSFFPPSFSILCAHFFTPFLFLLFLFLLLLFFFF